ncbi:MAG TPA: ribonuclease H-like YkuK family protein [Pseudobacteroides sp.]|nr:ribonuclease H-like YkuK family protein [Pseudobacteroides sp.]
MRFFNSTQKNMSFSDVVASIKYFIRINPDNKFRIAIGTDSQVKGMNTCFATGIHIHMIGRGAWCCISKRLENKAYKNLKEKISRETLFTYEIANMLNEQLTDSLEDFSAKYRNFECNIEAHIDIGTNGETRKFIREMVGYFEGSGINAKIKPESFVASSYANRYSKTFKVG